MTDDEMRFWDKVKIGDGCWEWQATRNRKGYGRFWLGTRRDGTHFGAHRVSWRMAHGPIPEGLHICHRCDNRACVRPGHLWLGTNADNVRDRETKGRSGAHKRTGDANGARKHRGRMARGDRNGARLHPETRCRGSRHHSSKLSPEQVSAIRELVAAGSAKATVARSFGVAWQSVDAIVKRTCWKHVK